MPEIEQRAADKIDLFWFQKKFGELHDEHLLILRKIDDVNTLCVAIVGLVTPNKNVTSELEAIIKKVSARALAIDRKVPDKQPTKKEE